MIKLHNSEKVKRVLENHFSQKIRKTFGNITKKLNILNRPVLAKCKVRITKTSIKQYILYGFSSQVSYRLRFPSLWSAPSTLEAVNTSRPDWGHQQVYLIPTYPLQDKQ